MRGCFRCMRCGQVHALAVDLMRPLAVVASIAVVVGSLAPADAVPKFAPDYVLHFVGYAGVALVWLLAVVWCPGQQSRPTVHARRRSAIAVLVVVIAIGAVLELAQNLIGRTTAFRDLIANIAGVAVGWAVWSQLVRICKPAAMDQGGPSERLSAHGSTVRAV